MPPEPARTADTLGWLRRAQDDLRAAEVDLAVDPPLLRDAAFHCQQATEKALKSFLTWHDTPFRRTHDLSEIGRQCARLDASLESICRRAAWLTAYAWVFRYPGEPEEPSEAEVQEALTLAREVHEAILSRLPEEVRL
jgi:HEPN domain-containing protein